MWEQFITLHLTPKDSRLTSMWALEIALLPELLDFALLTLETFEDIGRNPQRSKREFDHAEIHQGRRSGGGEFAEENEDRNHVERYVVRLPPTVCGRHPLHRHHH